MMVCPSWAELRKGSLVMMLMVPAMADAPKRAEPPPRITSTRSIMLAGICSSPYHAGLEVQSLSQCGRVGLFEELEVHDVDQRGGQAAGSLTAIGGDHHAVQRHEIFLQFEVLFERDTLLQDDFTRQGLVAHGTDLQRELAFGQVLQKIVARSVGQGTDGGALQRNGDIRKVFLGVFLQYMSHNVGIRTLQFFGHKGNGQQCAQHGHHKKDIFFHVSSILVI